MRASTESVARRTSMMVPSGRFTANAIQFAALLAPSLFITCSRCDAFSLKIVASAPRLHEVCKRLQRRFRDVMLDALGVRFRRLGRDAERTENIDHKPMANAHALGQRLPLVGKEHPAIGPRGR